MKNRGHIADDSGNMPSVDALRLDAKLSCASLDAGKEICDADGDYCCD